MTNKTRATSGFLRMGWVVGSVSLLLLIGAVSLAIFSRQALEEASVAALLLGLYLATWSYVFGFVGLALLSVGWLRVRGKRRVDPVVPNRSSGEGDDRTSTTIPSKVA